MNTVKHNLDGYTLGIIASGAVAIMFAIIYLVQGIMFNGSFMMMIIFGFIIPMTICTMKANHEARLQAEESNKQRFGKYYDKLKEEGIIQ